MSWIHWKNFKYSSSRNLHSSVVNRTKDMSTREEIKRTGSEDLNLYTLRWIDKKILVWSGKYKRFEDVPDKESRATVAKSQSVCRIKVCNYMIVATLIGAIYYVISGKRAAEQGHSLAKMNREWHEEYNRKYEEEQQKKLSKG